MSLLGNVLALFSGSNVRNVCVVDGDRLAGGDRVGPGERFQALSRLARFATREVMTVTVVFGGRPLREAADEDNYNGVVVRYGETPEDVRAKIERSLASAGRSNAVLVTSDQELENEMVAKGYSALRISTLRKAMEPSGSEGGGRERGDRGERGDRDGGRRSRNRNRGRRSNNQENREVNANNNQNDSSSRSNDHAAPQNNSGSDSVKNLIDLVE